MCDDNIDWTKCADVNTDVGRSMSGCYGGLQALVQRKALDALWIQRIIHREGVTKSN